MRFHCHLSHGWKVNVKNVIGVLSFFALVCITATSVSAITAQEVMENALDVYDGIDNYKAVVQTYQTDSMEVSGSIFDTQQPIISFNLFFRKPDEHAVKEIGIQSRYGIFRIELLSALGTLKDLNIELQRKDSILGQKCYVLEISSPERPEELGKLWISQRDWRVVQFSISMASLEIAVTQFKYIGAGRKRGLPVETRSFFPLTKQVLINRITDYKINTVIPPEIFKKKETKKQSK